MRSIFKSAFLWEFLGGFAVAAVALVSLQPADATRAAIDMIATHFAG